MGLVKSQPLEQASLWKCNAVTLAVDYSLRASTLDACIWSIANGWCSLVAESIWTGKFFFRTEALVWSTLAIHIWWLEWRNQAILKCNSRYGNGSIAVVTGPSNVRSIAHHPRIRTGTRTATNPIDVWRTIGWSANVWSDTNSWRLTAATIRGPTSTESTDWTWSIRIGNRSLRWRTARRSTVKLVRCP